jgi:hypothetical protein
VAQMSEAELLTFLFLPGFSLRDKVTEVSGRGSAWMRCSTWSANCAARSS